MTKIKKFLVYCKGVPEYMLNFGLIKDIALNPEH